jgi:hypothetical protein
LREESSRNRTARATYQIPIGRLHRSYPETAFEGVIEVNRRATWTINELIEVDSKRSVTNNQDNPNYQYPKNFSIYEDHLKAQRALFFDRNPAR